MSNQQQKIRFLAIDDSLLDSLALNEYAKAFDFLESCGTFSNALEGFEAQQYLKPDLVFLDIEMPGVSGIDLLRKIREQVPMAVFITSHPEFALDGFELSALDYVLKPLTEARFATTARRIAEYWEMKQKSEAYEVLFEKDMLTIKEGYHQIRLAQRDIVYLEAMQDYTKIVTPKKKLPDPFFTFVFYGTTARRAVSADSSQLRRGAGTYPRTARLRSDWPGLHVADWQNLSGGGGAGKISMNTLSS